MLQVDRALYGKISEDKAGQEPGGRMIVVLCQQVWRVRDAKLCHSHQGKACVQRKKPFYSCHGKQRLRKSQPLL